MESCIKIQLNDSSVGLANFVELRRSSWFPNPEHDFFNVRESDFSRSSRILLRSSPKFGISENLLFFQKMQFFLIFLISPNFAEVRLHFLIFFYVSEFQKTSKKFEVLEPRTSNEQMISKMAIFSRSSPKFGSSVQHCLEQMKNSKSKLIFLT